MKKNIIKSNKYTSYNKLNIILRNIIMYLVMRGVLLVTDLLAHMNYFKSKNNLKRQQKWTMIIIWSLIILQQRLCYFFFRFHIQVSAIHPHKEPLGITRFYS